MLWSELSLLGAETAVGAEKTCLDLALCPAQWYPCVLQFLDLCGMQEYRTLPLMKMGHFSFFLSFFFPL